MKQQSCNSTSVWLLRRVSERYAAVREKINILRTIQAPETDKSSSKKGRKLGSGLGEVLGGDSCAGQEKGLFLALSFPQWQGDSGLASAFQDCLLIWSTAALSWALTACGLCLL